MYSLKSLWDQARKDTNSARLDRGEVQALISWGVKFQHYQDFDGEDFYELIVAYEGDFYKKLPLDSEQVLRENGWRKGVLLLALARCNRKVATYRMRIENVDENSKVDSKKYMDMAHRALENAVSKSQSIQFKLNYHE